MTVSKKKKNKPLYRKEICGFWEAKNRHDNPIFFSRFITDRIIKDVQEFGFEGIKLALMRNPNKKTRKHPDYILYLYNKKAVDYKTLAMKAQQKPFNIDNYEYEKEKALTMKELMDYLAEKDE